MQSGQDCDARLASGMIEQQGGKPGALPPLRHAVQDTCGFIDEDGIVAIARALNLTRADVHGVVSVYHDFRRSPGGRHILKLCRAEACQAAGGEAIAERMVERLGLASGGTTADGALTVEPAACLGLCACAPAALLDGRPIGRLTAARLEGAIAACGA